VTKGDVTVHVILVDGRYEYDRFGTGDRLGDEQWQWLDLALSRGADADVTLIGSGIQIIPDRARPKFVESFGTANKLRLLDALRRSKLDRVILLTGDVHLAHLYE
jgi:phosphodiesterase/alkaline phosphatase D-like protein